MTQEEEIKELAKLKGKSAAQCQWCKNWFLADDVRKFTPLCQICRARGAAPTILRYMKNEATHFLNDEDRQRILKDRTVRTGPFFRNKHP